MPTGRKVISKVIAADAALLDPLSCDSTVQYRVISDGRNGPWGTVQLADCNRKIEWYFSDTKDATEKIDKAITMLQAFKDAFIGAKKSVRTRRKKNVRSKSST